MPKRNFMTLLLGQNIPLNTSVKNFFHKVPSKCGFIGGVENTPPLQELIAQNPYRSRVKAVRW